MVRPNDLANRQLNSSSHALHVYDEHFSPSNEGIDTESEGDASCSLDQTEFDDGAATDGVGIILWLFGTGDGDRLTVLFAGRATHCLS